MNLQDVEHSFCHSLPQDTKTNPPWQENDLITAFFNLPKDPSQAEQLLQELSAPLSPKNANSACRIALSLGAPLSLLNTLLDHCPPIPEFQFEDMSPMDNLLDAAIILKRPDGLKLLLERGADPNAGPHSPSPLATAFRHDDHRSLELLLQQKTLRLDVSEHMLEYWGCLRNDTPDSTFAASLWWSAHMLLEHLTGIPANTEEPYPLHPRLELRHALRNRNLDLATQLCKIRPLTEEEQTVALAYFRMPVVTTFSIRPRYSGYWELDRENLDPNTFRLRKDAPIIRFLLQFLERYPHLLNTSEMRAAVTATAMNLPTPNRQLQQLVDQMDNGPVSIYTVPLRRKHSLLDFRRLDATFFSRWKACFGDRLIPAFSTHSALNLLHIEGNDLQILFENAVFFGERLDDTISAVAEYALQHAPLDLLPRLMQPGVLLAEEPSAALFQAIGSLSECRRNQLLPFLKKDVSYDL